MTADREAGGTSSDGTSMVVPDALASQVARVAPTSFRKDSLVRLASDIYALVTALIAATISARVLGPSGRGYYASLVLLSVVFVHLFNAGIGEAAVVLSGQGRATLQAAAAATTAVTLPLGLVGAAALLLVGQVTLHPDTSNQRQALALAGILVLLVTYSTTLAWFLVARDRLVLVGGIAIITSTVSTAALWVLLVAVPEGSAGAIAASVVAAVVGLVLMILFLRSAGISLRPVWNGQYLGTAVRFGLAFQMANMLVQLTGRLDLILVYRIAGSAPAGRYSIALTIGALVGAVPIAIAFASFSRLSVMDEVDAGPFTAYLFRIGVGASILCAVGLAGLTPIVVPSVFGATYAGAIRPALLLIPGGVVWSGQWILCRAAAARGATRPLLVSFAASFAVMVLLDLVLIGPFGVGGAAIASLSSSGVGFAIAGSYYFRHDWQLRNFVPTPRDVAHIIGAVRGLATGVVGGRGTGGSTSEGEIARPPGTADDSIPKS